MAPLQLTITPCKPTEIPSEQAIIAAGVDLIDSVSGWRQGKAFHSGTVRTFSRAKVPGDGAPWHYRVSDHAPSEATFDDFWDRLGKDKPEHEKNFIHELEKVTLVKVLSPTQSIWTLYYRFTPPVSPRVFTVVQTVHLDESSPRTGIVISMPVDLSEHASLVALEEKGVRGRYVSVERITELPDKKTRWEMATSSTPGGSIPAFVAESSMDKMISNDVPGLLKYLRTHPVQPTTTKGGPEQPAATSTAPPPTTT